VTNSIFVTATMRGSGKSALVVGLASVLERSLGRVGYFKPVGFPDATGADPDVRLMKETIGLDHTLLELSPVTMEQVQGALGHGAYDELLDRILDAYERLAPSYDFVICEGTDYFGAMASFEFNINAALSKNLSSPILLIANGQAGEQKRRASDAFEPDGWQKMLEPTLTNIGVVKESFDEMSCELFGVIINRVDPAHLREIQAHAQEELSRSGVRLLGAVPRAELLEKARIEEVAVALHAEVLSGQDRLDSVVQKTVVAAMGVEHVLQRIQRGSLVVVPGDRQDVLLGLAAAYVSPAVPSPSGIIMTGGMRPGATIMQLVQDTTSGRMPILAVSTDTYETAIQVSEVKPTVQAHHRTRIEVVKELVESHVDVQPIVRRGVVTATPRRVTPKQFIYRIVDLARRDPRRIVLPEGREERILKASEVLLQRRIVDLTLLGPEAEIMDIAGRLGLKLPGVQIIDPSATDLRETFARRYIELRQGAKKNPTWDLAYDLMLDPTYFGTMMVHEGLADGMVSGSITTTAATLRPALEFIKTRPGVSIASSVFFMCLPDQVLVYGDCAVNPNPDAEELADIALASAETARSFEIEPYVAMLSYSTGSSGKGSDVDKVREATRLVQERNPSLPVEGPIQYDAAVDPSVARTKLPESRVAGAATVLVFPDLNSGNNTYKAVQRAARAIAVGPVMQGLRMPVNDLSRGCTIPDIINTVAITAIQAQRNG
jgi:phosphate acetyltransferase